MRSFKMKIKFLFNTVLGITTEVLYALFIILAGALISILFTLQK
jgi:hypothetical protein